MSAKSRYVRPWVLTCTAPRPHGSTSARLADCKDCVYGGKAPPLLDDCVLMQLPSPNLSYLHFTSLGIQNSAHTEITVKTWILLDQNTTGLSFCRPALLPTSEPNSCLPCVSVSIHYYSAEEISCHGNLLFQKSLVLIMCRALETK